MHKKLAIIYICVCFVICALPFVGMVFYESDSSVEKQELATFPALVEKGAVNVAFLPELGEYFEDHFAFRQELVSADSILQGKIFGISNVDAVVVGNQDWLYYSDSLKDYLGTDVMSDRAVFNAASNIAAMQRLVEDEGKTFVFTIAPNKNTLYGDNMPYYHKKVSDVNNLSKLEKVLQDYDINYVDLKKAFLAQEETLYMKRDSHWNNKGALFAYNEILGQSGIRHDTYEDVNMEVRKDYIGDLSEMIYPSLKNPEENQYYDYEERYKYILETESVEDALIMTEADCENKQGLLMYRDSFGNTLLPLMANQFRQAYFSKLVPYSIETDLADTKADVVIVEKVERNLDEFSSMPPVILASKAKPEGKEREVYTYTTLEAALAEENSQYIKVSGVLDRDWVDADSKVYARITNEDNQKARTYEALLCSIDGNDYGYTLYLDKEKVNYENAFIEIMGQQGKYLNILYEDAISFDQYGE